MGGTETFYFIVNSIIRDMSREMWRRGGSGKTKFQSGNRKQEKKSERRHKRVIFIDKRNIVTEGNGREILR